MYLVSAFVVMQVVDAVFQYLPFRDPDAIGRLILILLVIGFPVVLVLAWLFEMTPPQLIRERPRDETPSVREATSAVEAKELRPDSVAVLPFENLSPDQENEYFSDGITDDIIAAVAHIRGLRVLSRTSTMQYKATTSPLDTIAAALGVATIVTGSVRRSGPCIRIVATVLDATRDQHLWSETYDRDLVDIFKVQSEVAGHVAEAVNRELSVHDRARIEVRGTTDSEAYDLYLRARFLWNQRSEAAVAGSVGFFQRALERDPHFALAQAGLAEAYVVLGIYGERAPVDALPAARDAAQRALDIDPLLGEAVAAQACVAAVYDRDWSGAASGFQRALELSPSYATAHQWYAMNVLTPRARFDEALIALERASELDPASGAISVSRGIVAYYSRNFPGGAAEFEAVTRVHPRFALGHYFLGQCQMQMGDPAPALAALQRAVALSDDSSETLAAYGHALAQLQRTSESEEILARLEVRSTRRYVSPVLMAQILIGLGRTDMALDRLDQAMEARAADLMWLGVRPTYDALRESPRFTSFLSRLGLGG